MQLPLVTPSQREWTSRESTGPARRLTLRMEGANRRRDLLTWIGIGPTPFDHLQLHASCGATQASSQRLSSAAEGDRASASRGLEAGCEGQAISKPTIRHCPANQCTAAIAVRASGAPEAAPPRHPADRPEVDKSIAWASPWSSHQTMAAVVVAS